MRYELATLILPLAAAGPALPGVEAWCHAPDAAGTLLGCWLSEAGAHARLTLLRSFADDGALQAERWRTLATADPFGCGAELADMVLDSFAPFPWVAPVQPGRYGQVYEIRVYRVKPGGVPATMAAWQAAIPARERFSPLLLAMYALDGAPRFAHIWPYRSLAERNKVRAQTVARGVWPPKGAPDWLTGAMDKIIAVPTPISRLL